MALEVLEILTWEYKTISAAILETNTNMTLVWSLHWDEWWLWVEFIAKTSLDMSFDFSDIK